MRVSDIVDVSDADLQQPIHDHIWWHPDCVESDPKHRQHMAAIISLSYNVNQLLFGVHWAVDRQGNR